MQTVPPTAGPLAACPNCGTRLTRPDDRVNFEYGVGVVGHQHCGACGSRWRYLWQDDRTRRGRDFVRPGFIVLLVAAVLAGAIAFVATRGPDYPSHWDARIQPIAAQVAHLRGLAFDHPVKVNFLTPAAFAKLVATSPSDAAEHRDETLQTERLLRAAGLIGAHVDLVQALNTTQIAGTVALYDESTKQVYVRGTGPMSVETRVTLAHELTHVLQDQTFDLGKLRGRAERSTSGSADALRALVEGDATRIESQYLAGLSPADRRAYALESLKTSADASRNARGVPAVVSTFFDAPYLFGTPVAQVLAAEGGNRAVDAALEGPPPSTRMYFQPNTLGDVVDIPAVPELLIGEKKLKTYSKNDESLDDFDFFLMLAARLDLPTALRAADAYATASQIAYERNGRTCFRATIAGSSRAGDRFLASVLQRWAETMPAAGATPTTSGAVLRSCDPGNRAQTPGDARIVAATRLVAARDDLVVSLARQPLPVALAVCAARLLVRRPDFARAISSGSALDHPTPQMLRESADAGVACRGNHDAGIP